MIGEKLRRKACWGDQVSVYQLGYCKFILDKPQYRNIAVTPIDEESYEQRVIACCPICGSEIDVFTLLPQLFDVEYDEEGFPKELVWFCGCSNKSCPSRPYSLIIKTDNPVPLSVLDRLIDRFKELAVKGVRR
jgi:hypothetical protein